MPPRARLRSAAAGPTAGRPTVIALCGPDGAGKSTLVRELRRSFAEDGLAVRLGYGYGCLFCRRLDRPSGVAGAAATGRSPNGGVLTGRPRWRDRLDGVVRRVHGHVDAAELAIRLAALRAAALVRRSTVVVTDRGPLDGLAKHDPAPGSPLARRYLRLASRYDLVVLLDAPAEVLAHRDGEHRAEELEHWRLLYRRWTQLALDAGHRVLVADTAAQSSEVLAHHLRRQVTGGPSVPEPAVAPRAVPVTTATGMEPAQPADGVRGSGDA